MHGFTVKVIVLVLYAIFDEPEILHPKFKFAVNDYDVLISNTTVAVDPVPE